jgi:hypothetical protein
MNRRPFSPSLLGKRADLDTPDTGHGMAPGNLDCLVEIRAVEQVEADAYLLSLGEGPASANVDPGRVGPGRDDRR